MIQRINDYPQCKVKCAVKESCTGGHGTTKGGTSQKEGSGKPSQRDGIQVVGEGVEYSGDKSDSILIEDKIRGRE